MAILFSCLLYWPQSWYSKSFSASPFGKVPTLEFDGRVITDSVAICRYLASKAGIGAANAEEDLQIDQVIGATKDLSEGKF